jgi:hypothetical protein
MATFPTSLGEAALALAAEQPVLPLEPAGKRPLGGLGLTHATQDEATVREWWRRWPDANVATRCDGLLVLDVDGAPGEQSLRDLQRRCGPLPASRVAQTGKGRHLIYAAPTLVIGNSTAGLGRPPGIDVRGGTRGYVVAPPSMHASGRRYRWLDERPPAPLPEGWREPLTTIVGQQGAVVALDCETGYGRAALAGELERLLRAKPGVRNETLNAVVFRLAQLVAGGQLSLERVESDCLEAAQLLGLGAQESRLTVRSATRGGLRFPGFPRAGARVREISAVSKDRNLETFLRIGE